VVGVAERQGETRVELERFDARSVEAHDDAGQGAVAVGERLPINLVDDGVRGNRSVVT